MAEAGGPAGGNLRRLSKRPRCARAGWLWVAIGLLLLLLPAGRPAAGQAAAPAAIDAYIEAKMEALQIPGLAAAVLRDGELRVVRGYGTAGGRPMTPETPLAVASLSKSFTAVGILQLAEAGRLELDDPVQAHLPWFQTADPEASARITLRHLLHQTSGFDQLEGYTRNLERDLSDQALEAGVRRLSRSRLNAAPGEQFEYSNTNYDILGLVIQAVSGMPYEAYVQERIFGPLKMDSSYTGLEAARRGGLSSGYASFFGLTLNFDRFMPYSRTVVPSAGLFSSASDMARYLHAHLNQGRGPDGTAVLSPAGMAALHTAGVNISEKVGYAMGWTVFAFPEAAGPGAPPEAAPTGLSHGGDWANYKTVMLLIPERELGVVVLMNKNLLTQDSAYDNIVWNTALLALDLEPVIPVQPGGLMEAYGRGLGAGLVLLLAGGAVYSSRSLRGARAGETPPALTRRQARLYLVFWPLLDLALAGYLVFVHLPQATTTLPLALSFEPDAGLLYLLILVLTLGWGTVRTILAVDRFRKPPAGPEAAA